MNSKWITDLNVRTKIKSLDENTGVNLLDLD